MKTIFILFIFLEIAYESRHGDKHGLRSALVLLAFVMTSGFLGLHYIGQHTWLLKFVLGAGVYIGYRTVLFNPFWGYINTGNVFYLGANLIDRIEDFFPKWFRLSSRILGFFILIYV